MPMKGEWHSYTPDGRPVVVRRQGELWIVTCGRSRAQSKNLDVALSQAVRSEADVVEHAHEVDYPTWIRTAADRIDPET